MLLVLHVKISLMVQLDIWRYRAQARLVTLLLVLLLKVMRAYWGVRRVVLQVLIHRRTGNWHHICRGVTLNRKSSDLRKSLHTSFVITGWLYLWALKRDLWRRGSIWRQRDIDCSLDVRASNIHILVSRLVTLCLFDMWDHDLLVKGTRWYVVHFELNFFLFIVRAKFGDSNTTIVDSLRWIPFSRIFINVTIYRIISGLV
mgnify:CR=1 FL=1